MSNFYLDKQAELETLRARVQELEAEKAALLQLMRDKADEIVFAATHPETFGVSTFEEIAFSLANPEKPE